MKKIIYLLLALPLLAAQCKKDDSLVPEELPAITSDGKGTFGCLIDGEVFVAKEGKGNILTSGLPAFTSIYYVKSNRIFLAGNSKDNNKEYHAEAGMSIQSISNKNNILFDGRTTDEFAYYRNRNLSEFSFVTDSISRGEMKLLRFDTVSQIIAGTFWFDVRNGNDTIKIREGRFDLPFTIENR